MRIMAFVGALGLLVGCHAVLDPDEDLLQRGDADTTDDAGPTVDAGPVQDAGPLDDAGSMDDAGPIDDAGPMNDAGPMPDIGPPDGRPMCLRDPTQCGDPLCYNMRMPPPMPPCCDIGIDGITRGCLGPREVCLFSTCGQMRDPRAGVCVRPLGMMPNMPNGTMCRLDEECASGFCDGGVNGASGSCGQPVPMLRGTCEERL